MMDLSFRQQISKAAAFTVAMLFVCVSFAQQNNLPASMMPTPLKGAEVIDKSGAELPLDVQLTNHLGQKVKLGEYFGKNANGRPVIVTLGYYNCPMLCNLVLNGLVETMGQMNLKPGKDFSIVTVGINPEETADLAAAKRKNYLKSANLPEDFEGWSFHVGEGREVKRLADALGFGYVYDKRSEEYAHGAAIFIVSPEGKLNHALWGISFRPSDVKLALIEASEGKVGSVFDKVILSCFHYEPDSHRYGVYIFGVMRAGGILTILALGILLTVYWRSEKRRKTI